MFHNIWPIASGIVTLLLIAVAQWRAAREGAAGRDLSLLTRALMISAFGSLGIAVVTAATMQTWSFGISRASAFANALAIVGWAIVALGGLIVFTALTGLRWRRTWAVTTSKLTTTGVYGLTRNPRALGWFSIYAGLGLASQSAAVLCLAGVFLVAYLPWILLEEVTLEEQFGDEYRAYRNRTRRFI